MALRRSTKRRSNREGIHPPGGARRHHSAIPVVSSRTGRAGCRVQFVDAVEETVRELSLMPEMGARKEIKSTALKGLRFWPVREFEAFLIFYLLEGDTVRVIRVLHGKRDLERILRKESAGG